MKEKGRIVFIILIILIILSLPVLYYIYKRIKMEKYSKKEPVLIKEYELKISDEHQSCQKEKEKFYSDDNYNYYYDCDKISSMFIYINGKKEFVDYVLRSTTYDLTINDLEKAGLVFTKEEKLKIEILDNTCSNEEELIWIDDTGSYYLKCYKSENINLIKGDYTYNLKNVLLENTNYYLDIKELQEAGLELIVK